MNLILASRSPRRKELLKAAGFEFSVRTKNVSEDFPATMTPEVVPLYLAEKKAEAFRKELRPGDLIIAADTVVILNEVVINKPADPEEARTMLRKLSGQMHSVVTGVCLLSKERKELFSDSTLVMFKTLEESEIDYYVNTYQPLDKAGAYGVQEFIGMIGIERIEGCFYNVMGLPVARLYENLKNSFHYRRF